MPALAPVLSPPSSGLGEGAVVVALAVAVGDGSEVDFGVAGRVVRGWVGKNHQGPTKAIRPRWAGGWRCC